MLAVVSLLIFNDSVIVIFIARSGLKMFKPEIHIYNHDGSFRYRMAVERIPVKDDVLQLDGFFYEVEKVLFSDNGIPRVLLSQENLDLSLGEFTEP